MEKKETWQRVVKTSLYIALPIKNKARRISLPDFFNDVMQKEAAKDVGRGKYERIGLKRTYLAIEPGLVLEITI